MRVDTNPKKIEELLTRGVENIYPTREFLEKRLKSGERLTLYTGYDPTAPTLHIGHGITMIKLRQFQELGHKVIMLIGDMTGMIGDPTDKTSARQQLTRKQVLQNCKEYKKQARSILDFGGKNPVQLKYNSKWLGKLKFADILELSSHFTVQRMLERDMFQKRVQEEKPIYLHEFMYPLMQAYDSVAMGVDGEVGGNDQTFNMLCGRDLIKDLKHKEKFVLTMKLLADNTGKKMGKSEGNMVALSDTPEDMFGKVMSWNDEMIVRGFELCTRVDVPAVEIVNKEPMKYKKLLAYEVTRAFLGGKAADAGRANFEKVHQSKDAPDEILEIKPSAYDIVTVLVESKICVSRGDARRQIEQGGVRVNDARVDSPTLVVKFGDVVQKGSRFFVRVG